MTGYRAEPPRFDTGRRVNPLVGAMLALAVSLVLWCLLLGLCVLAGLL